MAFGTKGPFPEVSSRAEGFEENGFIRSSESAPGHQDGDHLGKFEWPNSESGEGTDGNPAPCGSPHWLNE